MASAIGKTCRKSAALWELRATGRVTALSQSELGGGWPHGYRWDNLMAVILVVEDEPFIREIAVLMIEDLGHTMLLACDVDEALVFLRSTQPIDALFTDIRLKAAVHGGYELADTAIKLRPKLRVLYATGSAQTGAMKAFFVEGGCFLQKPYSQRQLQNSMQELLAAEFVRQIDPLNDPGAT